MTTQTIPDDVAELIRDVKETFPIYNQSRTTDMARALFDKAVEEGDYVLARQTYNYI
jgi:hypothetical protein